MDHFETEKKWGVEVAEAWREYVEKNRALFLSIYGDELLELSLRHPNAKMCYFSSLALGNIRPGESSIIVGHNKKPIGILRPINEGDQINTDSIVISQSIIGQLTEVGRGRQKKEVRNEMLTNLIRVHRGKEGKIYFIEKSPKNPYLVFELVMDDD